MSNTAIIKCKNVTLFSNYLPQSKNSIIITLTGIKPLLTYIFNTKNKSKSTHYK